MFRGKEDLFVLTSSEIFLVSTQKPYFVFVWRDNVDESGSYPQYTSQVDEVEPDGNCTWDTLFYL